MEINCVNLRQKFRLFSRWDPLQTLWKTVSPILYRILAFPLDYILTMLETPHKPSSLILSVVLYIPKGGADSLDFLPVLYMGFHLPYLYGHQNGGVMQRNEIQCDIHEIIYVSSKPWIYGVHKISWRNGTTGIVFGRYTMSWSIRLTLYPPRY